MHRELLVIGLALVVLMSGAGAWPAAKIAGPLDPPSWVQTAAVPLQGEWTLAERQPRLNDSASIAYDAQADRVILLSHGSSTSFGDVWTYNVSGNLWTNFTSIGAPRFRTGYQVVYDPVTDQILLYGGNVIYPTPTGAYLLPTNEVWTYAFNTRTWTNATPATGPPVTFWFSTAFDSKRDRLVLFGGRVGFMVWSNVTWIYDVRARQWTNVTPAVTPSARDGASMAYDSMRDRVVLFGGEDGNGTLGDLWSFNPATSLWLAISAGPGPQPVAFAPMVFDPGAQRMFLFGDGGLLWAYDAGTNAWTSRALPSSIYLSAAPYYGAAAVFATESHVTVVLQVGQVGGFGLYSYSSAYETWNDLGPGNRPGVTIGPSLAFDAAANRTLLFGGSYEHPLMCNNLTWAYDLEHNRWSLRFPAVEPPCGPIVYDSTADRLVLFAGTDASTWVYDYGANGWTRMHPTLAPPVASAAGYAMTYDAKGDRVILFGGIHAGGGFSRETWAYNLGADVWENRTRPTGPPALTFPAMAYDSLTGRVVLFGGVPFEGPQASNETWLYDSSANIWTNATQRAAPPARSAAGLAYDSRADRFILFGGSGSLSTFSDTWTYDANANRWTEMQPAGHPSARSEFGMAYDSANDRVVLLGGNAGGASDGTWLYAYPSATTPSGTGGGGTGVDLVLIAVVIVPIATFGVGLLLWTRRPRQAGGRGKA